MLFYQTIDTKTLELLKEIQSVSLFKKLRLVGGTSLALQIGHRISVDLDFFGQLEADKISIINALGEIGKVRSIHHTENINIYTVNDIKVDIVNYPYPWLSKRVIKDKLYLADVEDIAAMKLAAITGRGSKKDFVDIYFLLKRYKLDELLAFYKKKYPEGSIFLVLRSVAYFDDADLELMPKMITPLSWDEVKKTISKTLKEYVSKD